MKRYIKNKLFVIGSILILIVLTFDAYTAEEICFSNSNITTYVGIEYEAVLDDCLMIEDTDGCVGQIANVCCSCIDFSPY